MFPFKCSIYYTIIQWDCYKHLHHFWHESLPQKIGNETASLVVQNLVVKPIRWWHAIRQQNWRHRLINKIDLPKHRFISELIHCNTNSLGNWFTEAPTRQGTGSLHNKLFIILFRWNTKSSANWFVGHHNSAAEIISLVVLLFGSATNSLQTTQFDREN
jgi:hypothetical protein